MVARPAPSPKQWEVRRQGGEPKRQTTRHLPQTESCQAKILLQGRRNSHTSATADTQRGGDT